MTEPSAPTDGRRRWSSLTRALSGLAALTAVGSFLAAIAAPRVSAHDIPNEITIQAFVRPAAEHLRFLARVPLEAMQDMGFPTTGPGYLDFERARQTNKFDQAARLWIADNVEIYENDVRLPAPDVLAVRVSLPSNRSFTSYEEAIAHVQGPRLPAQTRIVWQQAMLDVLLDYPIDSDRADFSIRPTHARLGLSVMTILRFLPPEGGVRVFEYHGDPGLLRLDPRWFQAALQFVDLGFFHILDGIDHLLFIVCLVLPFRHLRPLITVVTAFTVAHSISLIAAVFGLAPDALWFPALVELLIAASIVYMAFENIIGARIGRRWIVTFFFGLVHGFGFSFLLQEKLQFAGSHLLTSLLSFNVGVEIGQILVLILLVPLLDLLFRHVVAERMGIILLSAIVAHTSWHWMTERAGILSQYNIDWPLVGAPLPTAVVRWLVPAVIVAVLAWRGSSRWRPQGPERTSAAPEPIALASAAEVADAAKTTRSAL